MNKRQRKKANTLRFKRRPQLVRCATCFYRRDWWTHRRVFIEIPLSYHHTCTHPKEDIRNTHEKISGGYMKNPCTGERRVRTRLKASNHNAPVIAGYDE